jgi:hypothetical protein
MKSLLILSIFLLFAVSVFPQETDYFDAPFGGGGGYVGGWIIPKVDGINAELKNFGVPDIPSSGFYTSGGAGFIYLGIIQNIRIGGIGFGGSRKTTSIQSLNFVSGQPIPIRRNYSYKEADYSLGGGGLTIEYTLPFIKDFGISVGGIIGLGSLNVTLYQNQGSFTWQDFWNNYSSLNSYSYSATLHDHYWFFTPTVNVDIPAYRLLDFRIGVGYQATFANSWTYDNGQEISGVPSGINGNGFYVQAGVFVGLFSF